MNMHTFVRSVLWAATLAGSGLLTAAAQAQVFSNSGVITIPATSPSATATPYPSTIIVAGVPGTVANVQVQLRGLSHAWTGDVGVLLVAPSGQAVVLMNSTGGNGQTNNATLTFAADATSNLPIDGGVISGRYLPTTFGTFLNFPAPAPAAPHSTDLATLNASNANGTWNLYVIDRFPSVDGGLIARGWALSVNGVEFISPATTEFTYQGKLDGVPTTGPFAARFSVWDAISGSNLANRVFAPITQTGLMLSAGVFTTSLDFGALPTDRKLWLQVEVSTTGSDPYTTLSPRQPLSPAPLASVALNAVNAVNAVNAATASMLSAVSSPSNLNRTTLLLAGTGDVNHALRFSGAASLFAGLNLDGPVMYGFEGGGLGTTNGGERVALVWSASGNIGIGGAATTAKLSINGIAGSAAIRFPDSTIQITAYRGRKLTFGFDFGLISANGVVAATAAFPASEVGDTVIVNSRGSLPGGLVMKSAYVISSGLVRFELQNGSTAIDPPSVTFDITVLK